MKALPHDNHLLQYVSTGMYFGRVKVVGKTIRRKLDTNVYTTAKLRGPDFIKRAEVNTERGDDCRGCSNFAEAQALYSADMDADVTPSDRRRTKKRTLYSS